MKAVTLDNKGCSHVGLYFTEHTTINMQHQDTTNIMNLKHALWYGNHSNQLYPGPKTSAT